MPRYTAEQADHWIKSGKEDDMTPHQLRARQGGNCLCSAPIAPGLGHVVDLPNGEEALICDTCREETA